MRNAIAALGILIAGNDLASCDGVKEIQCPQGKVQVFRDETNGVEAVACASNGESKTVTCGPGQKARIERIHEAQSSDGATGNNTTVVICEGGEADQPTTTTVDNSLPATGGTTIVGGLQPKESLQTPEEPSKPSGDTAPEPDQTEEAPAQEPEPSEETTGSPVEPEPAHEETPAEAIPPNNTLPEVEPEPPTEPDSEPVAEEPAEPERSQEEKCHDLNISELKPGQVCWDTPATSTCNQECAAEYGTTSAYDLARNKENEKAVAGDYPIEKGTCICAQE